MKETGALTLTQLYNVLERLRELENGCDVRPLTEKERDIHDVGLVTVLKEIHDDIDRATFEAYGWEDLIPALVGKPGGTTPSLHKTAEQEQAEEELLSRLVKLNQVRVAEEAQGVVRWLRPEYQIPKLGGKVAKPADSVQLSADIAPIEVAEKPKWPQDGLEQIRVVRDMLSKANAPASAVQLSANFKGGRNRTQRVEQVLEHMLETGIVRSQITEGKTSFFMPR